MMRRIKAFTLIELLVVVAIIALLIAMLLPTLARAREQAKLVKCGANLHSIALALSTYNSQNQDLMPSAQPIYLPDWNSGNELLGWADQLMIDGDFLERTDKGGLAGANGDGSAADTNASSHYPSWGYGIMQCPNHSAQFQYEWDGTHSDTRYLQGYALAWCAWSGFYNPSDNGGVFSVHAKQLNPSHIIATEANGSMGVQSAYWVPAHMQQSSVSPGNYVYGVFERHLRGTTYCANYLFADSHVEASADYGWAPSPLDFISSRTWTTAGYKGPSGNSNALSRVWVHGVDDN